LYTQEDIKGNETTNRKRSDSLIEPPGNYHGDTCCAKCRYYCEISMFACCFIRCRTTR